jgi:hypothetical protein
LAVTRHGDPKSKARKRFEKEQHNDLTTVAAPFGPLIGCTLGHKPAAIVVEYGVTFSICCDGADERRNRIARDDLENDVSRPAVALSGPLQHDVEQQQIQVGFQKGAPALSYATALVKSKEKASSIRTDLYFL